MQADESEIYCCECCGSEFWGDEMVFSNGHDYCKDCSVDSEDYIDVPYPFCPHKLDNVPYKLL